MRTGIEWSQQDNRRQRFDDADGFRVTRLRRRRVFDQRSSFTCAAADRDDRIRTASLGHRSPLTAQPPRRMHFRRRRRRRRHCTLDRNFSRRTV